MTSALPPYLLNGPTWSAFWPIPVFAFLVSLLFGLLFKGDGKRTDWVIVLTAFSTLGLVTGYLTGLSRDSAVGNVLPAVLSLLGGFAAFVISKNKESRLIVGCVVFLFSGMLLLGSGWGAVMRYYAEQEKRYVEQEELIEVALKNKARIEYEVNRFRRSLGLSPLSEQTREESKQNAKIIGK